MPPGLQPAVPGANGLDAQEKNAMSTRLLQTVLNRQRTIFEDQIIALHQIIGKHVEKTGLDPLIEGAKEPSAEYLERKRGTLGRNGVRRRKRPRGAGNIPELTPDEMELKLVALLDSQGGLAMVNQVESYMGLMVKAATVEKRALFLSVLCATTHNGCLAHFVEAGGLHVLRLWIKDAADNDRTELVLACLEAVKPLPVTEEAVRSSEVGKVIKKLKRGSRSGSSRKPPDPEVVQLVDAIIATWTEKLERQREEAAKLRRGGRSSPHEDGLWRGKSDWKEEIRLGYSASDKGGDTSGSEAGGGDCISRHTINLLSSTGGLSERWHTRDLLGDLLSGSRAKAAAAKLESGRPSGTAPPFLHVGDSLGDRDGNSSTTGSLTAASGSTSLDPLSILGINIGRGQLGLGVRDRIDGDLGCDGELDGDSGANDDDFHSLSNSINNDDLELDGIGSNDVEMRRRLVAFTGPMAIKKHKDLREWEPSRVWRVPAPLARSPPLPPLSPHSNDEHTLVQPPHVDQQLQGRGLLTADGLAVLRRRAQVGFSIGPSNSSIQMDRGQNGGSSMNVGTNPSNALGVLSLLRSHLDGDDSKHDEEMGGSVNSGESGRGGGVSSPELYETRQSQQPRTVLQPRLPRVLAWDLLEPPRLKGFDGSSAAAMEDAKESDSMLSSTGSGGSDGVSSRTSGHGRGGKVIPPSPPGMSHSNTIDHYSTGWESSGSTSSAGPLPTIESFSTALDRSIRKRHSSGSTKRITWADREGGVLRQIKLFTVEEVAPEVELELEHVASQAGGSEAWQDLARREREQEREMLKKEKEEAARARADELEKQRMALRRMAPTTRWRRPLPINPEQLGLALTQPVESKEVALQVARTRKMMETLYLNASDIPQSPGELEEPSGNGGGTGTSKHQHRVIDIPLEGVGSQWQEALLEQLPDAIRLLDPTMVQALVRSRRSDLPGLLHSNGQLDETVLENLPMRLRCELAGAVRMLENNGRASGGGSTSNTAAEKGVSFPAPPSNYGPGGRSKRKC